MMGIGAFAVLLLAFALTGIAAAQGDPKKVSDDEVNAVARKLYCPVCENIPLDVCGTTACAQWREEIRLQLAEGATDQQVIDDFVKRFGDRVVGTPQDPTLRALSLAIPLGISALSLIAAILVFMSWRGELVRGKKGQSVPRPAAPATADSYRARIERDLAARR
jgi:cytochrome c-type biogenesis protein CcmH